MVNLSEIFGYNLKPECLYILKEIVIKNKITKNGKKFKPHSKDKTKAGRNK